jgi:hypothetical protein
MALAPARNHNNMRYMAGRGAEPKAPLHVSGPYSLYSALLALTSVMWCDGMLSVLQITPCGHVYSFSSIMQHLMTHGGEQLRRSGPCPLCYQPVVARELRLVQVRSSQTHSRRTPLGMPGGEDSWCAAQWWQHWCQRPGSCDSTAVSWCCIMVRATDMVLSAGPLGCSARGSVSPGA